MHCSIPSIPRPLQQHRIVSLISLAIFFTSFLLFLLVGLSLPIIKSIYIIRVYAASQDEPVSDTATELRFGVWGVCAISTFDAATEQGLCFGPKLGYTIPASILSLISVSSSIVSAALTALLTLLVLHLVVAGLSTLILILSLFLHSHPVAITALILSIIAALLSSVVFAADVAVVLVVKDNVDSLFAGAALDVGFGNAVWMILAGLILTWVAVVVLSARACYCCGVRRPRVPKGEKEKADYEASDNKSQTQTSGSGDKSV